MFPSAAASVLSASALHTFPVLSTLASCDQEFLGMDVFKIFRTDQELHIYVFQVFTWKGEQEKWADNQDRTRAERFPSDQRQKLRCLWGCCLDGHAQCGFLRRHSSVAVGGASG